MARVDPIPLPIRQPSVPRVLWIGSRQKAANATLSLGELLDLKPSQVVPTCLQDVDSVLIDRIQPTVVCSLLTWIGGDALEAAVALASAQYEGPYWAFGPRLPRPHLVEEEIRNSAPGIDFTIVALDRRAANRKPA